MLFGSDRLLHKSLAKEDFCGGIWHHLGCNRYIVWASRAIGHLDIIIQKDMSKHGFQLDSRKEPAGTGTDVRSNYG